MFSEVAYFSDMFINSFYCRHNQNEFTAHIIYFKDFSMNI